MSATRTRRDLGSVASSISVLGPQDPRGQGGLASAAPFVLSITGTIISYRRWRRTLHERP